MKLFMYIIHLRDVTYRCYVSVRSATNQNIVLNTQLRTTVTDHL